MPNSLQKSGIKMHARKKCALVYINSIFLCLAETYGYTGSVVDKSFAQGRIRATRQSGYVYDRPTISFNLPSRDIPASSSTQASPVDRTVMQMYYAYPVPASGAALGDGKSAVSAGYGSGLQSGGLTSNGNIGISDNGRGSVSQTKQDSSVTASVATSSSGGYNYGPQEVSIGNGGGGNTQKINQVSITNSPSSSGGYNYRAPDATDNNRGSTQVDRQTSLTDVSSNTDSGTGGYNYGTQSNIVKSSGKETGALSIPENSSKISNEYDSTSSSGYNYKMQNVATSQSGLQGDTAISTGGSLGIDTTSNVVGYNYEVQNVNRGAPEISIVADKAGYSVKSPVPSTTTATVSVSTNAPQYLPPPPNTDNNINVVNNNYNSNSAAAVSVQSDVYLPPSNVPTQTVPNVQSKTSLTPSDSYLPPLTSNTVTKTLSNTKAEVGSDVYLPPSVNLPGGIQPTSGLKLPSQNSITATSDANSPLNIKNTYLRPKLPVLSKEKMQTSLTISNQPQAVLSANYLPPIPTSREINQLVSTPAATYLPPVF